MLDRLLWIFGLMILGVIVLVVVLIWRDARKYWRK